ncbi:type I-C CRISPR-associated protein Cas8c/Csd1 [Ectothiorhodospiraceae bacterium BW-2]|nr:type I-C CRISPR-associated protein Cas8c/Csd1 [Ectothiorhodospiraceae bacterium BW-2]
MSWMAKLYDTYDAAMQLDLDGDQALMPISHSIQNAHIHIVLDGDGKFIRAEVLDKLQIMLPATEASAGRTSGEAPHALADKLQYVAADYSEFGGTKKAYFSSYHDQLSAWCNSIYVHTKAQAVLSYIEQERVIADLVAQQVIHLDDNGHLLNCWEHEEEIPALFKILPKQKGETDQGAALVCWSVELSGDRQPHTWLDETLQQSWVDYQASESSDAGFCFITGENAPLATSHPAKLRHSGDSAKLISANDSSGFTYRGRFTTPQQAASVGFGATQKAHNALRWLIKRQGFRNGDQVWVSWAVSGQPIPEPAVSSWDWNLNLDALDNTTDHATESVSNDNEPTLQHSRNLGAQFAKQLNRYLAGYRAKLKPTEEVVVMGLDSATQGRMSLIYYRELLSGEFLDRVEQWHRQFAWYQRHSEELPTEGKKKPKTRTIWPIASLAPRKIAETIYGSRLDDALKKSVIERLMPCIIDQRPLPEDLLRLAVKRVSNRVGYPTDEWWRWEQDLGVACALYRGYRARHPQMNQQKEYSMALEEENHSRDYLYGRLLAIAERIEEVALSVGGENRTTMAARLMQRFADRPYTTWRTLELSLQPYMQRLQVSRTGFLVNRKRELDQILAQFIPADFISDKALSGEFLLGYHCQRMAQKPKLTDDSSEHAESIELSNQE